jgi:putative ABC transport system permease protein
VDTLLLDLRFAARSLRRNQSFAIVAVLTLALGIGANAAMFAVVNAILLRPLPFAESDRLVRVTSDLNGLGVHDVGISAPELYDYRDRAGLFESITGVYPIDANVTEIDEPERVEILLVSPSYFSVLGARAQTGRVFTPEDDHPGIAEIVVISDAFWKRRFGARPDTIGRKLKIDGDWYEVVGIMPPAFRHPGRALRTGVEMWAPTGYRALPFRPLEKSRGAIDLSGAIARLGAGVSMDEAQRRLDAFAATLRAEYPAVYPASAAWAPRLIPLHDDVVGRTGTVLFVMLAAVGGVLAIACANIAGLLLARGAARQRELGIRRALGAGRARLARLLLAECALLACAGGVTGVVVAFWAKDLILRLAPANVPRLTEVGVDASVLVFTASLSAAAGLLFGLVPALQFSKPDLQSALKDARSASAPAKQKVRSALVIAQCALAMVLLVGAALLVRSFWRVMQVDAGIDAKGVLTARLWLPQPNDPAQGRYFTHPARLAFFQEVLRRAHELPGVEAAAIVANLPLDGLRGGVPVVVDGKPADVNDLPTAQDNVVSPEYFDVMRIPLRQGRLFAPADGTTGRVAIVNDEAARRLFPGQDPLMKRLYYGRPRPDAPWTTIIGVVGNVLSDNLETAPRPMVYRPLAQTTSLSAALAIRTSGDPSTLTVPLARAIRAVDPDQPMFAVRTMQSIQDDSTASRRFAIRILAAFAVLALVLSAVGIYGVMAYLVGQRRREIGIRMALGARRREVIALVVGRAVTLATIGLAIGGAASLLTGELLSGMLFQIAPWDPWSFMTIAGLLVVTAIAAAASPALRAAHVDPVSALRSD